MKLTSFNVNKESWKCTAWFSLGSGIKDKKFMERSICSSEHFFATYSHWVL